MTLFYFKSIALRGNNLGVILCIAAFHIGTSRSGNIT